MHTREKHMRGVLSGVSTAVIKAFFAILWDSSNPNQPRMQLDVLPGKRGPQAFLVRPTDALIAA